MKCITYSMIYSMQWGEMKVSSFGQFLLASSMRTSRKMDRCEMFKSEVTKFVYPQGPNI